MRWEYSERPGSANSVAVMDLRALVPFSRLVTKVSGSCIRGNDVLTFRSSYYKPDTTPPPGPPRLEGKSMFSPAYTDLLGRASLDASHL